MSMRNLYRSTTFIVIFLIIISCAFTNPKFEYKTVTDIPDYIETYNENLKLEELKKRYNLTDITNYLPKNYKVDGTIDYTDYLQKALYENKNILMPNFPILINDKGLEIPNNRTIVFNLKSLIRLSPSSKTNYQILRVHNKNNIVIHSPKIEGDRYSHLNLKGEWGMGISILSSSNISVYNSYIKNCWGDGIYVGQAKGIVNKNIKIKYGLINNNRRNGISIISVDGLEISNVIIANTNGTSPESGLDFEPNNNTEELKNIKVNNLYTFNNKTNGVVFYLARLRGVKQKEISVDINNHTDRFSLISLGFSSTEIPNDKNSIKNVPHKGIINLKNIESYNSVHPFRVYKGTLNEKVHVNLYPKHISKYVNISGDDSFKNFKISR